MEGTLTELFSGIEVGIGVEGVWTIEAGGCANKSINVWVCGVTERLWVDIDAGRLLFCLPPVKEMDGADECVGGRADARLGGATDTELFVVVLSPLL